MSVCGEYQRDIARKVYAANAGKLKDIDAILCANDVMALGVLDEIEATGAPRPPVVGINAIPQAITAIVAGDLLATVNFDAMTMSCIATEAALRYLRGEKVPRQIMLPVRIIDRNNYEKLDLPFAQRTCLSWQEVMNTAVIT